MGNELEGKRIAFLATDGVEQVELTEPWKAVEEAGGDPDLVSLETGEIQGFDHHDKADTFPVDVAVKDADPANYDGLVLPGGVINPDILRTDADAMRFVRAFFEQGKPVGSICHGPWSLVETGVVNGRKVTSWPSLRTDIKTPAAPGWTRSWRSTGASLPAASRTISLPSAPSSWKSSARACTPSRSRRPGRRSAPNPLSRGGAWRARRRLKP